MRRWTWKDWLAAPLAALLFAVAFFAHIILPRLFGRGNGWSKRK